MINFDKSVVDEHWQYLLGTVYINRHLARELFALYLQPFIWIEHFCVRIIEYYDGDVLEILHWNVACQMMNSQYQCAPCNALMTMIKFIASPAILKASACQVFYQGFLLNNELHTDPNTIQNSGDRNWIERTCPWNEVTFVIMNQMLICGLQEDDINLMNGCARTLQIQPFTSC